MKKNLFKILAIAFIGLSIISCSNPAKMAKESQLVSVQNNPKVLEVIADEIIATYTMDFPEGYFHPKAILEVVPVLVYLGGEVTAPAFKLQGEKVTDNFQVIPLAGGKANNTVKFAYKPGMEQSHLEIRVAVWNKEKKIDFPAPYKLADGANITYKLAHVTGTTELASYDYKKIIAEKKETQILYKINSSVVRPKELTSDEVKEFEKFLADVEKDSRREVKSTNIVAYASPDGSMDINSKLSDKRGETAKEAFDKITKKAPVTSPVNVSTIAEDWEGFQEMVAASTIQDKDLILRVLSMYSDPMVREREIKNMSKVFKTLADKILPELRRARFIANIDYSNYSDEELVELTKTNIEIMDLEALLYSATLVKNLDSKVTIYTKAGEKFKCDRAYNNLVATYLDNNKLPEAKIALTKITNKNSKFYYNNAGIIALRDNNLKGAMEMFKKSELPIAKQNSAIIDILEGRYNDAVAKLAGTGDENEGIAFILTNQLDKASKAITHMCPHAAYMRAVIAARQGNMTEVAKQLDIVYAKSESYKLRSQKDIEFAKFRE
jgi:outer membrane protein OmpA-like peptidoglycan-associated protein